MCILSVPALRRQERVSEFKANQTYIASSRPVRDA